MDCKFSSLKKRALKEKGIDDFDGFRGELGCLQLGRTVINVVLDFSF